MAVTAKWYLNGPKHVASDVLWLTDTIKVMLATSADPPNQDTDEFKSAVTGEVVGTGYTARGVTLASKTLAADAASNETRFDAADVSWTAASFTARYAIIYKDTGTDGTSVLLGYVDFGADETVSAGTFSIAWDATGALKIVAA